MKPRRVLISVVLPAPLGPSSPVAPSGTSQVSPLSAVNEPYRTTKLSIRATTLTWD